MPLFYKTESTYLISSKFTFKANNTHCYKSVYKFLSAIQRKLMNKISFMKYDKHTLQIQLTLMPLLHFSQLDFDFLAMPFLESYTHEAQQAKK